MICIQSNVRDVQAIFKQYHFMKILYLGFNYCVKERIIGQRPSVSQSASMTECVKIFKMVINCIFS